MEFYQSLISYNKVDESIQSEWLVEAEKRRNEIRNGLVQPISGEEALKHVRKLLG